MQALLTYSVASAVCCVCFPRVVFTNMVSVLINPDWISFHTNTAVRWQKSDFMKASDPSLLNTMKQNEWNHCYRLYAMLLSPEAAMQQSETHTHTPIRTHTHHPSLLFISLPTDRFLYWLLCSCTWIYVSQQCSVFDGPFFTKPIMFLGKPSWPKLV